MIKTNAIARKNLLQKICALFVICIMSSFDKGNAQVVVLNYKIMVAGSQVGYMKVFKAGAGGNVKLKLHCEVRKRVVWLYTVSEIQEAEFHNNKLVRSSCLRNVNGKVKVNTNLVYKDPNYEIVSDDVIKIESFQPITNHMLGVYFTEPTNGLQVYSDNFQQFIKIEKKAAGEYKIIMPDDNHSTYYYENGVCVRVKSKQTLFTVEMILEK